MLEWQVNISRFNGECSENENNLFINNYKYYISVASNVPSHHIQPQECCRFQMYLEAKHQQIIEMAQTPGHSKFSKN